MIAHISYLLVSCLIVAVLSLPLAVAETAKVDSVLDMPEFVHDWQISKQFTIEVAKAMPADLYDFKPNPDEMTFGEQMVHIAASNVYRFHEITGIKPPFDFDPAKPPASDKQNVLKLLEQSFDYVIEVLPQITHHRAQCEVYLRVKGIKPPVYTF
jgi:hypothetical protein